MIKGWYDTLSHSHQSSQTDEQDQVQRPGLPQGVGTEEFPEAKNNREAFKHYMTERPAQSAGSRPATSGKARRLFLRGVRCSRNRLPHRHDQNPRSCCSCSRSTCTVTDSTTSRSSPRPRRALNDQASAPIARAAEKRAGWSTDARRGDAEKPASGPDYLFTKHLGWILYGRGADPSAYAMLTLPTNGRRSTTS